MPTKHIFLLTMTATGTITKKRRRHKILAGAFIQTIYFPTMHKPMWKNTSIIFCHSTSTSQAFQNQSNAVFVVFLCLKLLAANKQQIWFKDKI